MTVAAPPAPPGRRDDLDEVDVAQLSALSALHDIGKFNHGFQRKGAAEARDTAGRPPVA